MKHESHKEGQKTQMEKSMKTLKFLVVALGLVVAVANQSALAATHKAKHAAHTTTDAVQTESGNPIYLQPGIGFVSGAFSIGVSLNASAVMRVTHDLPIYAGLDTFLTLGTNYGYYWDNNYNSSSVGVALLGTAFYKFTFPKRPRMHIIGGLSTGPFIGGGHVNFALLVRPGFTWDLNETMSISGEPVLGIIGSGFVFLPRAMLSFKL